MRDHLVLIGRDDELHAARTAVQRSRGVVFTGPAGTGKTRLADELAEHLSITGHEIVRLVSSVASRDLPLAAVAPFLPPPDQVIAAAMPLAQQARSTLSERAHGKPLVLLADDVHLLDDASATLVHHLVDDGIATLVATMRTGEPTGAGAGALVNDTEVRRVELGPLGHDDTIELAEAVLGETLDGPSRTRLWRLTRGNPLFVREVVAAAREGGALSRSADGVSWQEATGSARLVDLVEHRLAGLSVPARDVLTFVALGEPLGPGELDALGSPEALLELEERGLVSRVPDGNRETIRLMHPLHGEVLRRRISALRARPARRALAEALVASGARRRGDAMRLVVLALDGGAEPPVHLLSSAAATARFSGDMDVATRLARAAFDADPTFESAHLLCDVLYEHSADDDAALDALERLAVTPRERSVTAMARAQSAFWRTGEVDRAVELLRTAASLDSSPQRLEAVALQARLLSVAGRSRQAVEVAEPLLTGGEHRVRVQAATALGHAYRSLGRAEDALSTVDEALRAADAHGEQVMFISRQVLEANRAMALAELGRLADAEASARGAVERSDGAGDLSGQGIGLFILGDLLLARGRVTEAVSHAARAVELLTRTRQPAGQRWALATLALSRALSGDGEGAWAALRDYEAVGSHPARLLEATWWRAGAWARACTGDPDAARAHLVAASDACAEINDNAGERAVLLDLALLGDAGVVRDRIATLASLADGPLAAAQVDFVDGLARRDPASLAAAYEHFRDAGATRWALEAAAAARDVSVGDRRAGERWRAVAVELVGQCPGLRTPTVTLLAVPSDTSPVPLTTRERDVALLAAKGLTSREIGERLGLSARTVETHLGRAYDKLGVRGRSDLADVLGV